MAKAPPITRENAREMSAKGNAVRWSRWRAEREAAAAPKPLPPSFTASPGDVEAVSRTKSQLNALDALIDDALAKRDEERFLKLSSAKEKLWKLVQSVPGQSKRRAGRDSAPPIPTPQEAEPVSPSAAPKPV